MICPARTTRRPARNTVFTGVLLGLGLLASAPASAASAVFLTGVTSDSSQQTGSIDRMAASLGRENVCKADTDDPKSLLAMAKFELNKMLVRVGASEDFSSESMSALEETYDAYCGGEAVAGLQPYVVMYHECMMRYEAEDNSNAIRLVAGNEDATMESVIHSEREGTTMNLNQMMSAGAPFLTGGISSEIQMQPTGNSRNILNLSAAEHTYTLNAGMGGVLGGMGQVESTGIVWTAQNAPGMDIVRTFSDRFENVLKSGAAGSLMSGLLASTAGMSKHGIPLAMDQNVKAPMGIEVDSKTEMRAISVDSVAPDLCEQTIIPTGYTVTDAGEQLQASSEELSAGMAELNQAMESLTPEQREALSGLGLGSLVPGMNQDQPAAAPAGSSAPSSNRSASRSSDLMTDNLLQSIQLHLQALNIEPGNTSGEMDLNTQIAISQFQAKKGMKPTGEASPQLLGVLAAEVDK